MNIDDIDGHVWELSHEDGSSLFIQYEDPETEETLVFGPFLFKSPEELEALKKAKNLDNELLSALEGGNFLGQRISQSWVVDQTVIQFDPVHTDVLCVGELFIPLSKRGAAFLSANESSHFWSRSIKAIGEDSHRIVVASLMAQMFDQSEAH